MKNIIIIAAALATSALVSTIAQDPGAGRPGRPPGGRGLRPPPIVAALDANKDGKIDATELSNAVAALSALDKNGDGALTPDEFMGRPGGPEGREGAGRPPGGPGRGGPRGPRSEGSPQ